MGSIAFSPLAGGQLTNRYLHGIPADSRAASGSQFLQPDQLTESKLEKIRQLDAVAEARGQKLSQMALAWVLRDEKVTSVLITPAKPRSSTMRLACWETAVSPPKNRQRLTQSLRCKFIFTLAKSALTGDLGVPPMRRGFTAP